MGRGQGTRSPPRTLPQLRTRAHPSASQQPGRGDPAQLPGPGGPLRGGPRNSHLPHPPSPSEWIQDYTDSVPDPEALRVEVDAFMETYDRKIAEVGLPRGRRLVGPPGWSGWRGAA